MIRSLATAALLAAAAAAPAGGGEGEGASPAPDYSTQVAPVLKQYCAGCHNDADREGEFSLESYEALRKGTPDGPALKPGDAASSRMVRQLVGASKPKMPPKGEPQPGKDEVALIRAWIDAGAKGPTGAEPDRLALVVPKVESRARARPVTALDASRDGKWLAVGRYGAVSLHETRAGAAGPADGGAPRRVLGGLPGKVTAVHFTPDGGRLLTASGVTGLGGVAALWDLETGSLVREFKGHRDLLYDAELSPDGKTLATCGYDKLIRLWDAATGKPLRDLAGHNGSVYDVAFSPDGRSLVSASGDDTCKVWRVADGARLDTLPQPLKEEYACAFSPDGRTIVAGGADDMIRVWDFVARDDPGINPMVRARFAHESAIVRLAFTPDGSKLVSLAEDRTVKVWETAGYTELQAWEGQPDVADAVAVAGDGGSFRVGRLDGSIARFPIPGARADAPEPGTGAGGPDVPMRVEGQTTKAAEREPNDSAKDANEAGAPAEVAGTISAKVAGGNDVDTFRFAAKAGEQWVVEVDAARSGSKLDSFVEVLDSRGGRIPRVLLQAVRDSYFTFRGKDDATVGDFRVFNWEEMRLNEYLYVNGEVVKLWLYPRGPDSGFVVYPGQGKRWGFFDTTPLAHALGEPCYVVQPHPPGARLLPNGLPTFTLFFDNDDDSFRELGKDSRLFFTAPADGKYLVRVGDVRGVGGADSRYTLTVRPRRPDFRVTLADVKPTVAPGGAKEFKVSAKRLDGFDGPIRVDLSGLPPGFSATTPVVIEAGQVEALGVVWADPGAAAPKADPAAGGKVTATAAVWDREVTHPVNNFGEIKLGDKPQVRVKVGAAGDGVKPAAATPGGPPEFDIHPGETITLKVTIERNGQAGPVSLGNEGAGRNLPFGVYVDNLGLNGLLIPEGQDERTFFVTADRSVPKQTRRFHLKTDAAGGQASLPVVLHVR